MDRVELYCDQYKDYLSKVPQELSGTLTGVWKFERYDNAHLSMLCINV